jgi:hypothetical protein
MPDAPRERTAGFIRHPFDASPSLAPEEVLVRDAFHEHAAAVTEFDDIGEILMIGIIQGRPAPLEASYRRIAARILQNEGCGILGKDDESAARKGYVFIRYEPPRAGCIADCPRF